MKLLITSALLFLAISPWAQAHHDHSYNTNDNHYRGAFKAKVINSTPVYKYISTRQPHTYCEPIVVNKSHGRSHNKGAAIVGGFVGGMIGHAVSDKQHKGLGTIVGAVVGSSLVHNVSHTNNKYSRTYQVQSQNCTATYKKSRKVRVLDGYKVTYRAKGKLYRTFMQDKPARYISIYQ